MAEEQRILEKSGEEDLEKEETKSPMRGSKSPKKKRRRKIKKKEYPYKASMIPAHKPYLNDDLRVGARSLENREHLKTKFEIRLAKNFNFKY